MPGVSISDKCVMILKVSNWAAKGLGGDITASLKKGVISAAPLLGPALESGKELLPTARRDPFSTHFLLGDTAGSGN